MTETTVAATLAIDMLQYLERCGHAVADVCRDAGLDPTLVTRPDDRVPGSRMDRLWQVAIARTGDPLIGVHMSEEFHPAALDILGYVVLTCRTLGEAMDCLVRYAGLLNDGLRVELRHEGPRSIARIVLVSSHRDNVLQRNSREVVDALWIGLARQLRVLASAPVVPLEVWFRHRADDVSEYQRVLGAPVRFGESEDRFVLARSDLQLPIRSANRALFTVFEHHAEQLLATLDARHTIVGQVSRVAATSLRGRIPPIGEVAAELGMSARNLQRALRAEGRTYQQVLDDVRCAMARRYLADPAHPVSQVALLLGFSESAAFHRAFKRWTGTTPAMMRREPSHGHVS